MEERPTLLRPGEFGLVVAADTRRGIFDSHNEQLIGQLAPIAAVFAGDSITEGWALDAFFRSEYGLIVNRGISGDITPYLRRRFEADVLQLAPRLLVILIGINNTWDLDLWAEPALIRTPDQIEEQIVADVQDMVERALAKQMAVALCSILPTDMWALTSNLERSELVVRSNKRLREIAERHGAIFVDYHMPMAQEDGLTLRPGLADDGLHPNVVGYRLMADVLLAALNGAGNDVIEAHEERK